MYTTCFDVLVLQEVVQDVDGRLAGEEHLLDEVRGVSIDGYGRARRVRTVDQRHQHLQPHMHHIQRRPTDFMFSVVGEYYIQHKTSSPYLVRHISNENLLQAEEIDIRNG